MNLDHNVVKNCLIINLSGRIDVHLAADIEDEITVLLEKHNESIVILNLTDVEYMSSSGLRVFVSLMRTLSASSKSLKLCNLSAAVTKVFIVVELMDMFDIYESEEEAIAS